MLPGGGRRAGGELLEGLAGVLRKLGRHDDLERDDEVAGLALLAGDALAAGAQLATAGRAGRHPEGNRAVQRGYPQVGAEDRLGVRDRDRQREVVVDPAEQVVRADPDQHVQVSGRAAALTGLAAAGEPDALAVGDAGREPDRDRAVLGDAAGARAL